jgi:hypothetical protein
VKKRIVRRANQAGEWLDRWFLVIGILVLFFVLGLWLWVDIGDAAECPEANRLRWRTHATQSAASVPGVLEERFVCAERGRSHELGEACCYERLGGPPAQASVRFVYPLPTPNGGQ